MKPIKYCMRQCRSGKAECGRAEPCNVFTRRKEEKMSILEVNHIKKIYRTRMGGDEVTALRDVRGPVDDK